MVSGAHDQTPAEPHPQSQPCSHVFHVHESPGVHAPLGGNSLIGQLLQTQNGLWHWQIVG
jgi:hypothetical protein